MSDEPKARVTAERGMTRIGIAIPHHVHERLQEITVMFGIGQGALLEAIVSTMGYKELDEIIKRAAELRKLEIALHRKASKDMLQHVRGKDHDTIRQMAQAADNIIKDET